MAIELCIKTVVLPGGKIEITAPELTPGQNATVVVTIEDNESPQHRHVIDILRALPGLQLFQSAEEVDAYMQEEHDSWERWYCLPVAMSVYLDTNSFKAEIACKESGEAVSDHFLHVQESIKTGISIKRHHAQILHEPSPEGKAPESFTRKVVHPKEKSY